MPSNTTINPPILLRPLQQQQQQQQQQPVFAQQQNRMGPFVPGKVSFTNYGTDVNQQQLFNYNAGQQPDMPHNLSNQQQQQQQQLMQNQQAKPPQSANANNSQRIEVIKQYYQQLVLSLRTIVQQLNLPDLPPQRRSLLMQQQEQVQRSLKDFTDRVLRPLAGSVNPAAVAAAASAQQQTPGGTFPIHLQQPQFRNGPWSGMSPPPPPPQVSSPYSSQQPSSLPLTAPQGNPSIQQPVPAIPNRPKPPLKQSQAHSVPSTPLNSVAPLSIPAQYPTLIQPQPPARSWPTHLLQTAPKTRRIPVQPGDPGSLPPSKRAAADLPIAESLGDLVENAIERLIDLPRAKTAEQQSKRPKYPATANQSAMVSLERPVETALLALADDWAERICKSAVQLALHRKGTGLEKRDLSLAIESNYGIVQIGSIPMRSHVAVPSIAASGKKSSASTLTSTSSSTSNPHHTRMQQLRKHLATIDRINN